VFDLRINRGGSDAFAAAISGFFYTDTTFYEYWSFYGSHGSFGIEDQFALFSDIDSVSIMYAKGRSLDSNKVIQVDSDSSWTGGVTPDIRPPLNDQTIDQMYLQGVDVELEYAIQQLDQMTGVKTTVNRTPVTYFLSQNYPNPFNPSTTISYQLPAAGKVTLKVFDILGKEITTLVNEEKTAGSYKVNFNGGRLGSGVYFYQLRSGSFIQTKKLVLLK
jgi:hypothetical protein